MGTTRVNFRIPEELVEKADVAAELTHRNRTEIVIEALRTYLDEIEDEDAFREDVIELYLDGDIEFETLRTFIGRQDADSVRASKALLEDGEALADDLAALE
ncbi:CopG family ribbon-helix-helix protein [Haloglomus halophilum]|uniref:CopG family ribbon-helix-helix protein n=1 Tax=Haloglomus halophilum TaxID=2962672 RepID=UPI0020C9DEF6|nr:ribbon-helix-helix protein, CopG family [Haloglomus halophilum]